MKDLNIPWSKLFAPDSPGDEPHPTSHHNAFSTLLMDDSPLKAELQPFNHLCVKEYTNVLRNRDLASLQEEKARLKSPSPSLSAEEPGLKPLHLHPPQLPVEIPHSLISSTIHHQHLKPFELPPASLDPPHEFQFDQSVGIQPGATLLNPPPFTTNVGGYPRLPVDSDLGQGVIAPQMLFKNPSPSMLSYQTPQAFQHINQSIGPFTSLKHTHHPQPHHPSTDAPVRSTPPTQGTSVQPAETTAKKTKASSDPPSSKKRKRNGKQEIERNASRVDSTHTIEYDETLLAVVGILDVVKFQSNVASWVKANGLWGPYPLQDSADADTSAHNPCKDSEGVVTLSDSESIDGRRLKEGNKKRRSVAVASAEATVMPGSEDGDSSYVPTNEKQNQENVSETPLWFDNPPTMRHWVDRGKKALATLGIPIEHGLKQ